MPGLCLANSFIFRDENLHCEFAIKLINDHLINRPSNDRIREILLSALAIEKDFISDSLPESLIGMNSALMIQYLEYVTDQLLVQMGVPAEFGVEQPFKFMEQLGLEIKGNFFEGRSSEYQRADSGGELNINTDEDF
jgi:ribonucleoside-diphosphate reductase beta chain